MSLSLRVTHVLLNIFDVILGGLRKPTTETITSIRVDRETIWTPEIEIVNRVFDFSPRDEINRKLRIDFRGKVSYSRLYRLRTLMNTKIQRYPYDIQVFFDISY